METMQNDIENLYSYENLKNKTLDYLIEYENDNAQQFKTLTEASNTQFLDALQVVGGHLFGGLDLEHDLLLLLLACRIYCEVSAKYNKVVSVVGFSLFSGLDVETVASFEGFAKTDKKLFGFSDLLNILSCLYKDNNYNYNNCFDNTILVNSVKYDCGVIITAVRAVVFNRLQTMRENGIKNKLMDGRQQVGMLAIANREYGWSAERIATEERARAVSIADLPKIADYVNHQKTLEIVEA